MRQTELYRAEGAGARVANLAEHRALNAIAELQRLQRARCEHVSYTGPPAPSAHRDDAALEKAS